MGIVGRAYIPKTGGEDPSKALVQLECQLRVTSSCRPSQRLEYDNVEMNLRMDAKPHFFAWWEESHPFNGQT